MGLKQSIITNTQIAKIFLYCLSQFHFSSYHSIEDWQQFCNIPSSTTSYNFSNVKFCRKNVPLKKIGCFSRISIQLKSNSYLIWWKLFCLFDFDCFSKIIICEEFPEFYLCHPDQAVLFFLLLFSKLRCKLFVPKLITNLEMGTNFYSLTIFIYSDSL